MQDENFEVTVSPRLPSISSDLRRLRHFQHTRRATGASQYRHFGYLFRRRITETEISRQAPSLTVPLGIEPSDQRALASVAGLSLR